MNTLSRFTILLFIGLTTNIFAFTPPSSFLDKPMSYMSMMGSEQILNKTPISVKDFIKEGINPEATLQWEKGGEDKYILVITIDDNFTHKTSISKFLFLDLKSPNRANFNRILLEEEEITGKRKVALINTLIIRLMQKRELNKDSVFSLNEDSALKLVMDKKYYKSLKKKYPNTILYVEDKEDQFIYLYLGFNEGTYNTRNAFVRVNNKGKVKYSNIAPGDEEDWELMQ